MAQQSDGSDDRSENSKNVSFWTDERVVKEFDKAIGAARAAEAVETDASRSDVLRKLMEDFVSEYGQGNRKATMAAVGD